MLNRDPQRVRTGYVLLAVLAVMVLMVTVLATLSKLSLRRALAAADAQVRLQQRLGSQSIESTLLPRATKVFDVLEKQADEAYGLTGIYVPFPKQIRQAVTIGGVTFDMVIADEDAKLNLNQVYHMTGPKRTETAISDLVGPMTSQALRMMPATRQMKNELMESPGDAEPEPSSDRGSDDDLDSDAGSAAMEIPRAFRGWGELFDLPTLSSALGSDTALPMATGEITCWGGGGLNIRRASDGAIREAAGCVLSSAGANRLVSRYRENPTLSASILIQQETETETDRLQLRKMLGETSTHFSIWIDASAVSRRSWRTFSVMQQTEDGITINERFAY